MYLMIIDGQIVSTDDIPTLFQLLGEYTKAQFSIREYVIQARFPGEDKAKSLIAMIHKQYPTTLVVIPALPPEFQNLPANGNG